MENVFILVICLLIGFAISAAVTSGMLAELRSVGKKDNAVNYIEPESFNITYSNEIYLKTDVNKIAKNVDRDGEGGGGPGGGTAGGPGGSYGRAYGRSGNPGGHHVR